MKKLNRTQIGNPILRKRAKKLTSAQIKTKKTQRLIADMFFTMRNLGVGLAAPQVGQLLQLAVIEVAPKPWRKKIKPFPKTVIINPKILEYSKQVENGFEGCLSFAEPKRQYASAMGKVSRPKWIRVQYLNEKGEKQIQTVHGFPARVFQHEIDHLNGVIFLDRMKDMKDLYEFDEFIKRIGKGK